MLAYLVNGDDVGMLEVPRRFSLRAKALDLLLSVGRFDESQVTHDAHRDNEVHGDRFGTQDYTDDRPLSRRLLERMIKRELPAGIYRCKGFVHLADDPANRYLLQVVGRRADLVIWFQIIIVGRQGKSWGFSLTKC